MSRTKGILVGLSTAETPRLFGREREREREITGKNLRQQQVIWIVDVSKFTLLMHLSTQNT